MTARFNHNEVSSSPAAEAPEVTTVAKAEGRPGRKWPLLVIILGIVLTVGWISGLAWMALYWLYR